MTQGPKAGWFDDPGGSGGERWWDGSTWTDVVRPSAPRPSLGELPAPQAPNDQPARRPRWRGPLLGALAVLVAAGLTLHLTGILTDLPGTVGRNGSSDASGSGDPEQRADSRRADPTRGPASEADSGHLAPMAWDDLATELGDGGETSLTFADLGALDRIGIVDRQLDSSSDDEVRFEGFAEPLMEHTSWLGVPLLWAGLQSWNFEWPSTRDVLGFQLGDADRVVSWGEAQALVLSPRAPDVGDFLERHDAWSPQDVHGGDAREWRLDGDGIDDTAPHAIETFVETIRVDEDLVVLGAQPSGQGVDSPFIELLRLLPQATFGEVFDPGSLHLEGRPEPPGGYLDPSLAMAYTSTWQGDSFVHQLHMLWPDAGVADRNLVRIQATYDAGGALAEVLGQGTIEVEDRRTVLTVDPSLEGSWADVRRRWPGELGDAFATAGFG